MNEQTASRARTDPPKLVAVLARNLDSNAVLGDGAMVLSLSFQQKWTYIRCILPNTAKILVRRYRHDAYVAVRET